MPSDTPAAVHPSSAVSTTRPSGPNLFGLLAPYWLWIGLLVVLTVAGNALNLAIPKVIASGIDAYTGGHFVFGSAILVFLLLAVGIFVLNYLQSLVQTYASERVARDLRERVAAKISVQEYAFIDAFTPSKLLTNLTSDVDAVKTFVSQAIASIISSVFLIIGASVLLLFINWKLALAVLAVVPFIAVSFYVVLAQVRKLFKRAQEAIDWLNSVITESILGAALIRLVNSEHIEHQKFVDANERSKSIGMSILSRFAVLIPVISFATNLATLIILLLGGHFVIQGSMSLGNFTAFNSYLAILIFPILIIGFMSNVIAQAAASYARITDVLAADDVKDTGTVVRQLEGAVKVHGVSVRYGEKTVLDAVSFEARPHTRTAILGPTSAGKTTLLYLMTGLLQPQEGTIEYDGIDLNEYQKEDFHRQVGFVFQDSIIFNLTLRENIAFSTHVTDEALRKAIETAELEDFVEALPQGLDTIVSERGTSLSGGQKQRIMLARALALDPKVLILDDFTARVDARTEGSILANVRRNYPDLTLINVTQKIAPIEGYEQIILLMEGEVLAVGTHQELLARSPEYVQIFDSQRSTESYERAA